MNYEKINKQFETRGKNPDMSKILTGDIGEITASIAYPVTRRLQASRAHKRLSKMLQQGDIEAADLIEYAKTANKLQRQVILAVLKENGYDTSEAEELRARQVRNRNKRDRTKRQRRMYNERIF